MIPKAKIVESHLLGGSGLIERENISIINASVLKLAEKTFNSFSNSMKLANIDSPLYITSNDGTLLSIERAKKFPVYTFCSGMTNSIRGASILSKCKNGKNLIIFIFINFHYFFIFFNFFIYYRKFVFIMY